MAATLQLVRYSDTWSTDSTLDLLNYTDGFNLAYGGWQQAIAAGMDPGNVIDALSLRVQGSSHDDLAAKTQALKEKLKQTEWYFDERTERYAVWLRAKMRDETGTRQTLLRRGAGKLGSSLMAPPAEPGNMIRAYTLSLERFPWWEATSATTIANMTVNCLGGTSNYGSSNTVPGDVPARVSSVLTSGYSSSYTLTELWMGFRSDRFGSRTEFVPTWDLGLSGVSVYNSTTRTGDSTAYGNYKVQVSATPADTSMVHRVGIALTTATSGHDPEAQRGKFDVLLRAKAAAGVWHVRLQDGYSSTTNWRTGDRVKIDSSVTTSWMLYPVGTIHMPPGHEYVHFRNYCMRIQAEQTTAGGALDLDCLVLIPTAEGAIHVDDTSVQAGFYFCKLYTRPEGQITGETVYSPYPSGTPTIEPQDFALPVGNGLLVTAAQRSTSQVKTDQMTIGLSYLPRWEMLRGSE